MSGLVSDFLGAMGSGGFRAAIGLVVLCVAAGLAVPSLAGGDTATCLLATSFGLDSFEIEAGLLAVGVWATPFSGLGFPEAALAGAVILDGLFAVALMAADGVGADLGLGLDVVTEGAADAESLFPFGLPFGGADGLDCPAAFGPVSLVATAFGELDFCDTALGEDGLDAAALDAGLAVVLETALALAEVEDPLAEGLGSALWAPVVFFTTAGFLGLAWVFFLAGGTMGSPGQRCGTQLSRYLKRFPCLSGNHGGVVREA